MKKILCVGNACVDITVRPVDRLPDEGKLQFVDTITTQVGGCAANAAIDLCKLGADAEVCTAVGDDAFGKFIQTEFENAGLNTGGVTVFSGMPTGASVVHISSAGERSFLHAPGVTDIYRPENIPGGYVGGCDILFLTGALIMKGFDGIPAAELLSMANGSGKITVMDTCWDAEGMWIKKIGDALRHLHTFIPSIEEAEMLAGTSDVDAICDAFIAEGVRNVIVKLGTKGAYVCEGSGRRYLSGSFKREVIADTNGAGDAFCAGYLCGLARGMCIKDSVRFANAVGSFSVTGAGPCSGIPRMDEVDAFLRSH